MKHFERLLVGTGIVACVVLILKLGFLCMEYPYVSVPTIGVGIIYGLGWILED